MTTSGKVFRRSLRGLFTVLAVVSTVTCAEAAQRRRLVKPTPGETTSLSGRAVDAQSGAPVFEVTVNVQGKRYTADREGSFSISELTPGTANVSFRRWGYDDLNTSIELQTGANTLNVTMKAKPVVTLTLTSGGTHPLDFESANFVYRGPFSGYTPLHPIDFCRADGTSRLVEKQEIATVVGPGRVVTNSPCCPNSDAIQVNVTLKSGETFTALLPECKYYKIDFTGRDRSTGEWRNLALAEVARLDFPQP